MINPKEERNNHNHSNKMQLSLMLFSLIGALLMIHNQPSCEAKEIDWSELGVAIANNRFNPINSNYSTSSNLRILVSPQRRVTKSGTSYEYEYTNASQPVSTSGETTYVIPSSGAGHYALSSSPSSSHSSAYSALSASLASLKSRLNARQISLGASDAQSVYSSPISSDAQPQPQTFAQQQQQVHQQSVAGQSQPSGTTYLSMASGASESPHSASAYQMASSTGGQHSQGGNKTIVLAIPAKINFLTDGRSSSVSKQSSGVLEASQPQQLTVLQPAQAEPATRQTYTTKQLVPIGTGQEALVEQAGAMMTRNEPQMESVEPAQQYVLVNSPTGSVEQSAGHLLSSGQTTGSIFPAQVYSAIQQQQPSLASYQPVQPVSSFAMKYLPTYQTSAIQNPTIQKIYTLNEPVAYEPQVPSVTFAEPTGEQSARGSSSSQSGMSSSGLPSNLCLDTCNSADPRWRKHSVSRYKYCCSRSAQYDAAFEQPSGMVSDKLAAEKQLDDAYYSYLYRRSKSSRRSRKQRLSPRFRYSPPSSSVQVNSASGAATSEDDNSSSNESSPLSADQPVRGTGASRPGYYSSQEPRYYRTRQQPSSSQSSLASSSQESSDMGAHEPSQSPVSGYKTRYSPSKDRAGRRGRSRELDSPGENLSDGQEPTDEDSNSPSYGTGEYSVDATGRYAPDSRVPANLGQDDDDSARPTYEADTADQDQTTITRPSSMVENQEYPNDGGSVAETPVEELDYQPDPQASVRPTSPGRRKSSKRSRKSNKDVSTKSHGGRKSRRSKQVKVQPQQQQHQPSQLNGTDFESTQVMDPHHLDQTPSSMSSSANEDDQSSSHKDSSSSYHETTDGVSRDPLTLHNNRNKANLNDSAVLSLSRTTMHLKEILSILERKAQLKLNETNSAMLATSTPPPVTTTGLYSSLPLFSSQYGSPSLHSALSSDFMMPEMSLKSPYKLDSMSLASFNSPSLNLPPSYSSLTSDSFSPLSSFSSSQYILNPKLSSANPQRKRRVNKNVRYNTGLMLPKTQSFGKTSSLLLSSNRNPFLNPTYYPYLQYPHWYPRNSHPYKTLTRSPYSSTFGLASKL